MERRARAHPEAWPGVKTLRVLPEAEEELAEAAEWYEAKRTGLGVELVALVDRAFDEIQDAPRDVLRIGARARIGAAT